MSGEAERLLRPRPAAEQLRAILEGAEHADGGEIASLARVVLAECDDLRGRIVNARAEIARQDVAATKAARPGFSGVCDALAEVETHLVAPEYRPERHFSPGYRGELPDHHGPAGTCAMPACVTARRQHEAAADLQDLTRDMHADNARGGAS